LEFFKFNGDEVFAGHIMSEALVRPYDELFINSNTPRYNISQDLLKLGYPYGYDLLEKKIVNTINEGLVDSAKSVLSYGIQLVLFHNYNK
jgi:chaperonin GroEL (HSP60 family)